MPLQEINIVYQQLIPPLELRVLVHGIAGSKLQSKQETYYMIGSDAGVDEEYPIWINACMTGQPLNIGDGGSSTASENVNLQNEPLTIGWSPLEYKSSQINKIRPAAQWSKDQMTLNQDGRTVKEDAFNHPLQGIEAIWKIIPKNEDDFAKGRDKRYFAALIETGNKLLERPPVKKLDVIYATGNSTPVGAYYYETNGTLKIADQYSNLNPVEGSPDVNFFVKYGLRYETKNTPQKIDNGTPNSGDGVVPYASLAYHKYWKSELHLPEQETEINDYPISLNDTNDFPGHEEILKVESGINRIMISVLGQ